MRLRNTTALLLALAAGLAAGCGGDEEPEGDPIPADAKQQLEARLDEVERRFEFGGGACADIANDSEPAVESILASLPQGVDPDVRSALEQSFERLFQLTADECDEQKGQETEPEEVEPPPETEPPIDTDTIPTETLPPETTEPPPPEEEEELPPEEEVPPVDPGQGDGGGISVPGEDE